MSCRFCAAMGPIYTSSTAAPRDDATTSSTPTANGITDRDEFSSIMHRLHLLPRDDEAAAEKALAQMFDMADVNHDGTVSFDEFCAMFHQHVGARIPGETERATRRRR